MPVGLLRVIDTKLASTENVLQTTDEIRIVVIERTCKTTLRFILQVLTMTTRYGSINCNVLKRIIGEQEPLTTI